MKHVGITRALLREAEGDKCAIALLRQLRMVNDSVASTWYVIMRSIILGSLLCFAKVRVSADVE